MTWIDGGEDTSLTVNQLLSRTPSDARREHILKANSYLFCNSNSEHIKSFIFDDMLPIQLQFLQVEISFTLNNSLIIKCLTTFKLC